MNLKDIEKEIIYLLAIKSMIDEMVNFEVIVLSGEDPNSEIRFNSMTHQKFFNIMLVDFLSWSDTKVIGEEKAYLKALSSICSNPHFNKDNSINALSNSTQDFRDWLNKEFIVEKVWLPSIDLEIDLSIKRLEFIKICGNISKHNFTRLSGVVRDIVYVFNRNEISLSDEDALAVITEFYDWFHNNIFSYHSSAIAEFLNNIRWDIYEYLQPEFNRSIVFIEDNPYKKYSFTIPEGVKNKFAEECYWSLMNEVRSEPYMRKFEVTKYLKMRY